MYFLKTSDVGGGAHLSKIQNLVQNNVKLKGKYRQLVNSCLAMEICLPSQFLDYFYATCKSLSYQY